MADGEKMNVLSEPLFWLIGLPMILIAWGVFIYILYKNLQIDWDNWDHKKYMETVAPLYIDNSDAKDRTDEFIKNLIASIEDDDCT